jgi:hypothetical protein
VQKTGKSVHKSGRIVLLIVKLVLQSTTEKENMKSTDVNKNCQ